MTTMSSKHLFLKNIEKPYANFMLKENQRQAAKHPASSHDKTRHSSCTSNMDVLSDFAYGKTMRFGWLFRLC